VIADVHHFLGISGVVDIIVAYSPARKFVILFSIRNFRSITQNAGWYLAGHARRFQMYTPEQDSDLQMKILELCGK
jgi:hypothetical protein